MFFHFLCLRSTSFLKDYKSTRLQVAAARLVVSLTSCLAKPSSLHQNMGSPYWQTPYVRERWRWENESATRQSAVSWHGTVVWFVYLLACRNGPGLQCSIFLCCERCALGSGHLPVPTACRFRWFHLSVSHSGILSCGIPFHGASGLYPQP